MELFTHEDLANLAHACTEHCLTICMPTHRGGPETRQDPIRFRNLLTEAEELLAADGVKLGDVDRRLKPAYDLLEDVEFWQQQNHGLAVFIGPDLMRYFRVPVALPEEVVIAPHFHVLPVLPALDGDGRFHILAASPGLVRLFEATRETVRELSVPKLPRDMSEMMRYIEVEQSLQWHTETQQRPMQGQRAGIFHGHGAGGDDVGRKLREQEFAVIVNRAVSAYLTEPRLPLVLVAAEPFASIYRETNTVPRLIEPTVEGNTDHMSPGQIRDLVWPTMEAYLAAHRDRTLADWTEAGLNRRAEGLTGVLPAAQMGRVLSLVVAADGPRWGRYDNVAQQVLVHEQPEKGDEDLVNLAAILTAEHGGEVHAVNRDRMPTSEPVVAVLRY